MNARIISKSQERTKRRSKFDRREKERGWRMGKGVGVGEWVERV